jgi:hypothetical protein
MLIVASARFELSMPLLAPQTCEWGVRCVNYHQIGRKETELKICVVQYLAHVEQRIRDEADRPEAETETLTWKFSITV